MTIQPSTLHDRLAALADEAPRGAPDADLWDAGQRRHRRRRVQGVLAVAVVVALVGGLGALLRDPHPVPPADAPFAELHLPRTVRPPSPWAPGTEEEGPLGPLATVAMARRYEREGLRGRRLGYAVFGVSAVDGSVRFLDIPGVTDAQGGLRTPRVALSPDGRKVGFLRYAPGQESAVTGWSVYDAVTGETLELEDPDVPEPRGTEGFDIEFTGDSRYLATNYGVSDNWREDRLVVWDVESGQPTVADGAGHYWLPNMGSGPTGVVWSRGRSTFTFDPESARTDRVVVPQEVVEASYGPDGQAFAYIGHRPTGPNEPARWWLYAGTDVAAASGRRLDLDIEPGQILGWRDARHVVVDDFGRQVRIVDVRTGEVTSEILQWPEALAMTPDLADAMWANDLVEGVVPPTVPDPRWRDLKLGAVVGALVLLVAGLGAWLWRRRVTA